MHGVYRRSIGSQYEVYDIGTQFVIYIQTGEDLREIYRADYTYTDSEIIIGNDRFEYILYIDRRYAVILITDKENNMREITTTLK